MAKSKMSVRFLAFALALTAIVGLFAFAPVEAKAATDYGSGWGITPTELTVYDDEACTVYKGKLFAGESFTVFNQSDNDYCVYEIEYSTSSGPKHGYIDILYADVDIDLAQSCVAVVNSSASVYYGNSTSTYVRAGSVSSGENVVVLYMDDDDSWAYIEYNTTSGRKRGFVQKSCLTCYNEPQYYKSSPLDVYGSGYYVTGDQTVYAGPSSQYVAVGSVDDGELVTYYDFVDNIEGRLMRFITYKVTGTNQLKSGFIYQ